MKLLNVLVLLFMLALYNGCIFSSDDAKNSPVVAGTIPVIDSFSNDTPIV